MIGQRDDVVMPDWASFGADAPILIESGGARDRGLLDPAHAVNAVCATVAFHSAKRHRGGARRYKTAPIIHYVILDQRILDQPSKVR